MNNILALDTSGNACSTALLLARGTPSEQLITDHQIAPMQQAKLILPAIQQLLTTHHLTFNDIDAVVFGAGPGSFTGLRLASSVVQAISYIADIPVFPVSSLAALAQSAYQQYGWERVVVAIDGRKDQIYWAPYALISDGHMALQAEKEAILNVDEVNLAGYEDWQGVGDAWSAYAEKLQQPVTVSDMIAPSADAVLRLGLQKIDKGEKVALFEALPVYLNPFKR